MWKWLSLAELGPLLIQFPATPLCFLFPLESIFGLIHVALHGIDTVLRRVHGLDGLEGGSGKFVESHAHI